MPGFQETTGIPKYPEPSIRTDIMQLREQIFDHFFAIGNFFKSKPSSIDFSSPTDLSSSGGSSNDTDIVNEQWRPEVKECERLEKRYGEWTSKYIPDEAVKGYDKKLGDYDRHIQRYNMTTQNDPEIIRVYNERIDKKKEAVMKKKMDLLKIYNRLYDATTNCKHHRITINESKEKR